MTTKHSKLVSLKGEKRINRFSPTYITHTKNKESARKLKVRGAEIDRQMRFHTDD